MGATCFMRKGVVIWDPILPRRTREAPLVALTCATNMLILNHILCETMNLTCWN